ncbi:DUF2167 domain-containing protein [Sphingopyxis flava]|uniref:Uncharacterized membrane-anchored protein n=1 Tax=Sphingopyxis flava TaxID=1507287 RepID=A0A1T5EAX6_9SPHN|nr:DUF2167 domain-containing protein [Sphingopyxis flava]SKB80950.1 Uncharacterized membrane-anchored protein [Sphingopyxis flava]
MKKPSERTSAFAFAAALAVAAVPATMLPAAALAASASAQESTAAQQRAAAERLLASLNRQTGTIPIDVAKADLVLGDRYYFVGPDQSRSILVDIWRNPPEAADNVLGMVFPKGKSFVDDSWSAVITFERSGYVSDEDAKTIDYDALLADMRKSDEEQADSVRAQGYPAGIVQRWAQAPTYDAAKHSLVWARDIKFDGSSEDALNYDIRLLGRSGVLSMNIIAGMSQLGEVHEAARTFAQVASFRAGARYADFDPSMDEKAEYGLAGLVAAGAGAAVAKKVGLLAILAKFGKLIFIAIIGAFVVLRNRIGRLFGRHPTLEAWEWEAPATAAEDDRKA